MSVRGMTTKVAIPSNRGCCPTLMVLSLSFEGGMAVAIPSNRGCCPTLQQVNHAIHKPMVAIPSNRGCCPTVIYFYRTNGEPERRNPLKSGLLSYPVVTGCT